MFKLIFLIFVSFSCYSSSINDLNNDQNILREIAKKVFCNLQQDNKIEGLIENIKLKHSKKAYKLYKKGNAGLNNLETYFSSSLIAQKGEEFFKESNNRKIKTVFSNNMVNNLLVEIQNALNNPNSQFILYNQHLTHPPLDQLVLDNNLSRKYFIRVNYNDDYVNRIGDIRIANKNNGTISINNKTQLSIIFGVTELVKELINVSNITPEIIANVQGQGSILTIE